MLPVRLVFWMLLIPISCHTSLVIRMNFINQIRSINNYIFISLCLCSRSLIRVCNTHSIFKSFSRPRSICCFDAWFQQGLSTGCSSYLIRMCLLKIEPTGVGRHLAVSSLTTGFPLISTEFSNGIAAPCCGLVVATAGKFGSWRRRYLRFGTHCIGLLSMSLSATTSRIQKLYIWFLHLYWESRCALLRLLLRCEGVSVRC